MTLLAPSATSFAGTPRFEVRRELGQGGFGTVYEALDHEHAQLVALKVLHRSDPLALRRFKQEFRALANLAHRHLVSLFELHQQDAHWFFTMELVHGVPFTDWLRPELTPLRPSATSSLVMTRPARPGAAAFAPPFASPQGAGPATLDAPPEAAAEPASSKPIAQTLSSPGLRPIEASSPSSPSDPLVPRATPTPLGLARAFHGIEIPDEASYRAWEATRPRAAASSAMPDPERVRSGFRQLVEALSWLHASGHLHRDVKPSNVLVDSQGLVKVLDFGLVTRLLGPAAPAHEALIGTPAFMAPEVCAGLPASPASDWYSVGVMISLALNAELPFGGDLPTMVLAKQAIEPRPPRELAPVPRDLEALCLALLARNPLARPDAATLLEHLGEGGSSRLALASTATFVGRRAEVARLSASLSGVPDEGRYHDIALVEGLSGLGKTALVDHVLSSLATRDDAPLVLRSRCFERGSVRYRALDGAIDDLAQYLSGLAPVELEALLPKALDLWALRRLFPALPEPLSNLVAGTHAPVELITDPQEIKRRAFLALSELLAAQARRSAVIVAIDDAQWADEDSLVPLGELMRVLDGTRVRWVLSFRSDERASSPFLRGFFATLVPRLAARVTSIALAPLSPAEALALADDQISAGANDGDPTAIATRAEAIAREAGGHPLFIAELARRAPSHDAPGGDAKASLAELLSARVAALDPEGRLVLELVAVASEPIPTRLVRAATGVDQRELTRLEQDRLVTARASLQGELVMTWHDRVREIVSGALSPEVRTARHRALAETATELGSATDDFLHQHWLGAGEAARAIHHGLAAADAARAALAFDREAAIRETLIALGASRDDLAATLELHERLAEARKNGGRGKAAAETYVIASKLAAQAGREDEARRLEIAAAEQFLFSGAFADGEAAIRSVLGRIGLSVARGVPRALASFAWQTLRMKIRGMAFRPRTSAAVPSSELAQVDALWSGTIGLSMANPLASQAFQQRHLRAALDVGEPFRVARALSIELAFSALPGGLDETRSRSLSERAHAVARTLDDPYADAFATMSDGAIHWLRGRWREAQAAVETAIEVYERRCVGVTWEKDTARFVALSALAHRGELAALAPRYERILADAIERGDLYLEVQLLTRFAPLLELLADRPYQARTVIDQALARWSAPGFQIVHYWGYLNRVQSFLYEGDAQSAWAALEAGRKPLKRSLMLLGQYYRVQFHDLVAKTALAVLAGPRRPESRAASSSLARAIKVLTKEGMPWSMPMAAMYRAMVATDAEARRALFAEAARGYGAVDMELHRWVCIERSGQGTSDFAPAALAALFPSASSVARAGPSGPHWEKISRMITGV
ncbi:MAG: protein kinase [Deltaproteobacteria bacterium]|nr:protein kinase [Deltaproteobacteria bacterium]